MPLQQLRDGIYAVGVNDAERRLFDELIPLPDGTSYNSYLVQGNDRTALIDTVDPLRMEELLEHVARIGPGRLDYVVANHAEQDHSGSIPRVLDAYPQAKLVTNAKCKRFLQTLLPISDDRCLVVENREELPLGGKTLVFLTAPWVHWPETMLTYVPEAKILFPCDFLGSHMAVPSTLYAHDEEKVYQSAKRYYAEIMMPFRVNIRKHLQLLDELDLELIAPSHGPVYDRPEFILDAYRDWVSDKVKNEVVLPYVSMHGSTLRMVDYVAEALDRRRVKVHVFNLTQCDLGELAKALVDAATLIMGASAFLARVHPAAAYAAYVVNALRPKLRWAGLVGSYGWGCRLTEEVTGALGNLKAEFLDPVISRGYPGDDDFAALDGLADTVAEKHREAGLM